MEEAVAVHNGLKSKPHCPTSNFRQADSLDFSTSKYLKIFPLCCCPVAESSLQYYRSSDFCRQSTVEKGSVSCFCIENNSINTFNIDSSYIWLLGSVTCNCKCFSGYLVVYLTLLLERFLRLWLRPSGLYPTDSVSVVRIISWFHLSLQSIRSSK